MLGELLRRHAIETGIRVGDRLRQLRDQPGDRQLRVEPSETAAQFAVVKDRHERAASDVGASVLSISGRPAWRTRASSARCGKLQEPTLVVGGDHHIAAAM